ncbi:hybrid sensor histidine kinase/response regulator [Candidatus Halobonum tyrrellensis]|uniref:histidine kinase n=1 Tax=Candidatus Halobonum tyrrellensis G22 TaxID=1324957 RepID=V4HAK8_9EURY|nr:PAS domain S-box protein [Candidatus Halobonum tyrrellensis]ESP87088.1 HTR-like protein [Candidatus Halobonum tyrrellensis G22]
MTNRSAPVRVLHVDDDADFAELTARLLEREDDRLAVETATSAAAGLDRLGAAEFDCVVAEYGLPGRDGIEFLRAVRAEYPDLPFVLLTGTGSEAVASEAISAGVTDYLRKESDADQHAALANRLTDAVDHGRSRRSVERSERRLREVVDAVPHPLSVVDESGRFLLANEALADVHGATVADLEGSSVADAFDDATARRVRADVADVLDSGEPERTAEMETVDSDGRRRVLRPRLSPSDSVEGDERAVVGLALDVTERSDREREAERARERMALALDRTDSIAFEVDFETGEVVRHGRYERAFAFAPEDLPTWEDHCEHAVHPDDRPAFRRFHRELIDGDRERGDIEYRTNPERGECRWIHAHVHVKGSTESDADDRNGLRAVGISRDVTERKELEVELRRKERRYDAVFDDPDNRVGVVDTDGTVLDLNRTAMDCLDLPREEVVGAPVWELPWFDSSAVVADEIRRRVERAADGEYVPFEIDLSGDGDLCIVEGVFRPVAADDGEVVSVIVSARETTEQRRRKRELERTNAVLSTLFDTLPVGVLAEDGSRTALATNQQLDRLFGVSDAARLVGADCRRLRDAASDLFVDPEGFVADAERTVAENASVRENELRLRDGRTLAWSHEPFDLPDGTGRLWTYRDVTDRAEYERRLQALNRTTQELVAAESREAIGRIAVEAARDILGHGVNAIHLRDEEREGLPPVASTDAARDLVGDLPTFTGDDSIAWRVYERGEARTVDDVHADADVHNPDTAVRSELYLPVRDEGILLAGSTVPDAFDQRDVALGEILAGNVAAALEQVRRTDQLRARESELTRQNDRLDGFVSVVSHDLRNPLNVAQGRLALAREDRDDEHLGAVARALDRMGALTEDLLATAREGEAVREVESVDLATVARDCWDTVETGAATLDAASTGAIRADRSRLQQVFENLFRNAVEHGGDGVRVEVGDLTDGFYVEDDGPGVPADERGSVFEAGYTTSCDGTGFGLHIVEQVADAHGWTVELVDGDGGARFEVTGVAAAVDDPSAAD